MQVIDACLEMTSPSIMQAFEQDVDVDRIVATSPWGDSDSSLTIVDCSTRKSLQFVAAALDEAGGDVLRAVLPAAAVAGAATDVDDKRVTVPSPDAVVVKEWRCCIMCGREGDIVEVEGRLLPVGLVSPRLHTDTCPLPRRASSWSRVCDVVSANRCVCRVASGCMPDVRCGLPRPTSWWTARYSWSTKPSSGRRSR
jgi:hypothetical protein